MDISKRKTVDSPDAESVHASTERIVLDWIRDDVPLAGKVNLMPEHVDCSSLTTDEQWAALAEEIIEGMRGDSISPMRLVETPREWDIKA